jgi:hypothetical protein
MTIPVFVNERRLEVPAGTSAIEAAVQTDPALADALAEGRTYLTDGRGIRLDPTAVLGAGAIVRVVRSARRPGPEELDAEP